MVRGVIIMCLFSLMRPLLHMLQPEDVHQLGLWALRLGVMGGSVPKTHPQILAQNVCGLHFAHPVGLAAGFDKNAMAVNGLLRQGFGFVECGTVTPKAQEGNPKPRIFRVPECAGIINRLGFNNDGCDAVEGRLLGGATSRKDHKTIC
jgi:dihydroorotate dehydrogenase